MRQTLPWESDPPPIYVSRPPKPRKKWVTVGGWILVVLLLLFGLMSKRSNLPLSVISFGLALLYTLTLLTKKDAVVTTRGLEIFYQMQITTQYDFFPWEQINSIVTEDRKHPDLIRLHIGYSSMEKALFFTRSDAEAIIKLAKEKNPAIRVLDYEAAEAGLQKTEKEITHKGPPVFRRSFSMLRPRRSPLFSPPIFVRSVIAQQHSAVI